MRAREFERGTVLRRVCQGELSIRDATPLLGVSYRHAKRLVARFRRQGAKGVVHAMRGRASNRMVPAAYRAQVLELVRAHYGGPAARGAGQRFGPTLVAEHLWTDHGLLVPVTTLTRWMRDADLWSRLRRARPRHQRRERKAHFGELVQLDGSGHDWFEGRGPEACTMTMVDDATSQTVLHFSAEETTWAAAEVLQAWIAVHGVPRALYTDWKNVYLRPPTMNEQTRGEIPFTQFGRMCAKLGIQIIGNTAAANVFVRTTYLPDHNARYAVRPASPVDYHRARDRRRWPDATVFCLETPRQVGADWVVQYNNRGLQLQPSARVPIKSAVLVREQPDGTLHVVHLGRDGHQRPLPWTPAAPRAAKPKPLPPARATACPPRALRPKPVMSHPWHRATEQMMHRSMRRLGMITIQPPIAILTPSHP